MAPGAPLRAVPSEPELRLPEIQAGGGASTAIVHRAVAIILSVFAVLAVLAAVAGFAIETDLAVEGRGTLEPLRVWPIRSPEAGLVDEILVGTGDTVALGQVLLRLDALPLREKIADLESQYRSERLALEKAIAAVPHERRRQTEQLARAEATLVQARAVLRQRLVDFGFGTNADSVMAAYHPGSHTALDIAISDVRAAEAGIGVLREEASLSELDDLDRAKQRVQIDQLRQARETLRERERRYVVTAPVDGVVLTSGVEALRHAGVGAGEALLEIEDLRGWRAELYVTERDAHRIAIGDPVKVEVDAFKPSSDVQLRGAVLKIAPEPVRSGSDGFRGARPYRVVVALADDVAEGHAREFRRGYTVSGKIVTRSGKLAQVLWYRLTNSFKSEVPDGADG